MTRASDFVPLNGISRRTFCKGAAVLGIWGGLASFGLAGCAPHSRAEELADSAPWKAGTYTTEVTGHNAPYTMTSRSPTTPSRPSTPRRTRSRLASAPML